MPLHWKDISQARKDGQPFWLGTGSGGVLLEAWHWCTDKNDFAGVFSEQTLTGLREAAPNETFLCADMQAPKRRTDA